MGTPICEDLMNFRECYEQHCLRHGYEPEDLRSQKVQTRLLQEYGIRMREVQTKSSEKKMADVSQSRFILENCMLTRRYGLVQASLQGQQRGDDLLISRLADEQISLAKLQYSEACCRCCGGAKDDESGANTSASNDNVLGWNDVTGGSKRGFA